MWILLISHGLLQRPALKIQVRPGQDTNARTNSPATDQFSRHLQNRFVELYIFQDPSYAQYSTVNDRSVKTTICTLVKKVQGSNPAPTIYCKEYQQFIE